MPKHYQPRPWPQSEPPPNFESAPGKTAMDAVKAILWIPDAAAKILLLVAVIFLGWRGWVLQGEVAHLKEAAVRTAEQRAAEMALLGQVTEEITLYRQAVIAKSGRLLNDGGPQ